MNNLLKVALSERDYTHLRVSFLGGVVNNYVYMDTVLNDFEVHYALDAILEEFEFPELKKPIEILRQRKGQLVKDEISVYLPDD